MEKTTLDIAIQIMAHWSGLLLATVSLCCCLKTIALGVVKMFKMTPMVIKTSDLEFI